MDRFDTRILLYDTQTGQLNKNSLSGTHRGTTYPGICEDMEKEQANRCRHPVSIMDSRRRTKHEGTEGVWDSWLTRC